MQGPWQPLNSITPTQSSPKPPLTAQTPAAPSDQLQSMAELWMQQASVLGVWGGGVGAGLMRAGDMLQGDPMGVWELLWVATVEQRIAEAMREHMTAITT